MEKKRKKNHNFLFKIAQNSEQDGNSTGLGLPLWLRLNYYTPKMRGHRQQWISHKMKNRHQWQLEKSKSFGAKYQLPIWPNFEVNGLDWQCCLAGSSKTAPRILIFSTAMGAKPSFYMKLIATYAPAFFGYNNPVLH